MWTIATITDANGVVQLRRSTLPFPGSSRDRDVRLLRLACTGGSDRWRHSNDFFDAIIIGGGGAACVLRCSGRVVRIAAHHQVFLIRSHTGAAEAASPAPLCLGDRTMTGAADHHTSGSTNIGDEDAIQQHALKARPAAASSCTRAAVPPTRAGPYYQRPFGGQSKDDGKGGQAALLAQPPTVPATRLRHLDQGSEMHHVPERELRRRL
ncbi:FAD-binding protein [Pseudomonas sp. GNP014]